MRTTALKRLPWCGFVGTLLTMVTVLGLCDVHGPKASYRSYVSFTPVAVAGPSADTNGHVEEASGTLTADHELGTLNPARARWLDTGARRSVEKARPAGRHRLAEPVSLSQPCFAEAHLARAPPAA